MYDIVFINLGNGALVLATLLIISTEIQIRVTYSLDLRCPTGHACTRGVFFKSGHAQKPYSVLVHVAIVTKRRMVLRLGWPH